MGTITYIKLGNFTFRLNAYIRPMTMLDVISAFTISNTILLTQYATRFMPLISCMCFKFFSLSFNMKLTTAAGINANPIDTTNTMKIPLTVAAYCLSFSVTGKGEVVTLNFRLGLPVACFKMASYMNCGYRAVTSCEVIFRNVATLNCLVLLLAS